MASSNELTYHGLNVVPFFQPPQEPVQQPPDFYINKHQAPARPLYDLTKPQFDPTAAAAARKAKVDWMLLLSPFLLAFVFKKPFVMPIFDLMHRVYPEFPEVSANGEANAREYVYINSTKFATLILVESEIGKADVLRFYGEYIDADRIRVLPMYPPVRRQPMPSEEDLARVRHKYRLPPRYFFYPAQFWRHKNHARILEALKLIADETGERISLVLCGSYADYNRATNFKELQAKATQLGVADLVLYLGITPHDEMGALYAMSVGLVMPTFFGPSNLPPLEALHFGRPVVTSNIPGMPEQMGDSALLVDPRSSREIADAMLKLWRDEALGKDLVERGRKLLSTYTWDSFVQRVDEIMTEASDRVRAGRTPSYP